MTTEGSTFAHLRPVLLVACASIAFSVNDVCLKLLSGSYPLHEIMFVRTIVAVAILVTVIVRRRDPTLFTAHRPVFLIARSLLLFLSNAALYSSFAVLPLADAVAVFFSAPLIITVLSALFLGEKVGPWRFSAILAGIAGVVLIVRPSGGTLGLVSVLPILSALFYALAQVLTRRIGLRERALTMALFGQSGFLGFCAAFGLVFGGGSFSGTGNEALEFLFRAWTLPSVADAAIFAALGAISAFGGLMMTMAYREGQASLIAPFEYVGLPLSILWGAVIWSQVPGASALAGFALILGAGVIVAIREARNRRSAI